MRPGGARLLHAYPAVDCVIEAPRCLHECVQRLWHVTVDHVAGSLAERSTCVRPSSAHMASGPSALASSPRAQPTLADVADAARRDRQVHLQVSCAMD
jgi:hypothetical protein